VNTWSLEDWRRSRMAAMRLGAIDLRGTGSGLLPRICGTSDTIAGAPLNFPTDNCCLAGCVPTAAIGTGPCDAGDGFWITVGLAMPVGGLTGLVPATVCGLTATPGARGVADFGPVTCCCEEAENRCRGRGWIFDAVGAEWGCTGAAGSRPAQHIHTVMQCKTSSYIATTLSPKPLMHRMH